MASLSLFLLLALGVMGCGDHPARVVITAPVNGSFTTADSVVVQAVLLDVNLEAVADVRVNGVSVGPLNGVPSFTTTVNLDPSRIEQPVVVEVTGQSGTVLRDRVTLIRGDTVADGEFSEQGVALRINDSGLTEIEPIITSLVPLDLASLVPPGTLVEDDYCYLDSWFGCLGRVDAVVSGSPPPSISSFSVDIDSMTDWVMGDVTLQDLYFKLDVYAVTGIGFTCHIDVNASSALIEGDFDLSPLLSDPEYVDVTQLGNSVVSFSNFSDSTNCDGFLGGVVSFFLGLAVGNLENNFVRPGLEDFLDAVDGSGNTPVAGAIETALQGIQIAGPIGGALGVDLEAPFYAIYEDPDGITFDSDARITSLDPDPAAPDLEASYHIAQDFPTFGPLTPNGEPYEMAISISASAFNQFLKAEIENGLLLSTITEFDFGAGPLPITAGVLAVALPQFGFLDPAEVLQFEIRPTVAPVYTGEPGPAGELATLVITHLRFSVVPQADPSVELLAGAVDIMLGVDIDHGVDGLTFQVTPPTAAEIEVTLLANPLYVQTATLEALLPSLVGLSVPTLSESLGSFPIPEFIGTELTLIDADRVGEYTSLFFDLSVAP